MVDLTRNLPEGRDQLGRVASLASLVFLRGIDNDGDRIERALVNLNQSIARLTENITGKKVTPEELGEIRPRRETRLQQFTRGLVSPSSGSEKSPTEETRLQQFGRGFMAPLVSLKRVFQLGAKEETRTIGEIPETTPTVREIPPPVEEDTSEFERLQAKIMARRGTQVSGSGGDLNSKILSTISSDIKSMLSLMKDQSSKRMLGGAGNVGVEKPLMPQVATAASGASLLSTALDVADAVDRRGGRAVPTPVPTGGSKPSPEPTSKGGLGSRILGGAKSIFSSAVNIGKNILPFASKAAAPVGVAVSAVGTGMTLSDLRKKEEEGTITPEEAKTLRAEAIGSGVGGAIGTVGGAILGSVLGPGGTIAGAGIGQVVGSKVGGLVAEPVVKGYEGVRDAISFFGKGVGDDLTPTQIESSRTLTETGLGENTLNKSIVSQKSIMGSTTLGALFSGSGVKSGQFLGLSSGTAGSSDIMGKRISGGLFSRDKFAITDMTNQMEELNVSKDDYMKMQELVGQNRLEEAKQLLEILKEKDRQMKQIQPIDYGSVDPNIPSTLGVGVQRLSQENAELTRMLPAREEGRSVALANNTVINNQASYSTSRAQPRSSSSFDRYIDRVTAY